MQIFWKLVNWRKKYNRIILCSLYRQYMIWLLLTMKYRQSCDTYILSNEVVSFWSEPKTTCFLFCGPIFIKEILIWGRYQRNLRKLGKKWWKNKWFYRHFCGLSKNEVLKKYYWYIVVITCNLYTDPNDLLFLLLAFWMIRASALQFARSLVRSTDGLKNQTGM